MDENEENYPALGKAFILASYQAHTGKIPAEDIFEEFIRLYWGLSDDVSNIFFFRSCESTGFSAQVLASLKADLSRTSDPFVLAAGFLEKSERGYAALGKIIRESSYDKRSLESVIDGIRAAISAESA